jgi:hypothetical protein
MLQHNITFHSSDPIGTVCIFFVEVEDQESHVPVSTWRNLARDLCTSSLGVFSRTSQQL